MAEEMGLLLNIRAKLESGSAERIKREMERDLSGATKMRILPQMDKTQISRMRREIEAEYDQIKLERLGTKAGLKDIGVAPQVTSVTGMQEDQLKFFQAQLDAQESQAKLTEKNTQTLKDSPLFKMMGKLPGGDILTQVMGGIGGGGGGGAGGLGGAIAGGAAGGLVGGMVIGLLDGIKSVLGKIWELFRMSSPMLQRSLKMLQLSVLSIVRPIADTFGRILYPIARFFMIWGRALYKTYREKYQEYIGQGMSPIEASIRASIESFVEGFVGLFTGHIGDYDFDAPIQTIVMTLMSEIIKTITKPEVMIPLLGIGAIILGAVSVAIAGAAATFLLVMEGIAWLLGGTLGTAIGAAGFGGVFVAAASTLSVVLTAAIAAAGFGAIFAAAAAYLWYIFETYNNPKNTTMYGGDEYLQRPPIETPWGTITFFPTPKNPWGFQHGGIVTKPTYAMIGEAGPEAVVPLSGPNAKKIGGGGVITNNITITGNAFFGTDDLKRMIGKELDDYMREFRGSR